MLSDFSAIDCKGQNKKGIVQNIYVGVVPIVISLPPHTHTHIHTLLEETEGRNVLEILTGVVRLKMCPSIQKLIQMNISHSDISALTWDCMSVRSDLMYILYTYLNWGERCWNWFSDVWLLQRQPWPVGCQGMRAEKWCRAWRPWGFSRGLCPRPWMQSQSPGSLQ